MSHSLSGVFPVFQTPYLADESIDAETLEREIAWLFEQGSDGIVMAMVSEVLRLSFKPGRWAEGTARAWATMHGYRPASVVVKEGTVRVNVVPMDRFVPGECRTVQISADISAVVGERKLLPRKKAPTKTASKGLKKPSPQGGVPVRSTQRDFRRSPLLRRRG